MVIQEDLGSRCLDALPNGSIPSFRVAAVLVGVGVFVYRHHPRPAGRCREDPDRGAPALRAIQVPGKGPRCPRQAARGRRLGALPTRNIRQGGLAFLHGGYVHPCTRCPVQLTTRQGGGNIVGARVVHYRYLEVNIHELGIHFDRSVVPSAHCSAAVHNRVPLVEDDPSISRLATFYLRQLNADVEHAQNGQIAVEKAMENIYDLILMDMEMPVLDGFAATRALRSRGSSGLIVAATSLTRPADRERCLKAGCDGYLPKPVSGKDLAVLLESLRREPPLGSFSHDPPTTENHQHVSGGAAGQDSSD